MDETSSNWLFDVDRTAKTSSSELAFGRIKSFLYESLHKAVTTHNLEECFKLLRLLAKETALDPYVLFKFIMILIESSHPENINKNVIIYLELQMSKLDLCKPEIFVEFLAYFVRHDKIDTAIEMFAQRQRHMTLNFHRTLPFVDVNLRCYEFLFQYQDWEYKAVEEQLRPSLDVSIQGWVVNLIDCLKSVTGNYEYFVLSLSKVLLYYGYSKRAYLFVSEFQRNNPNNLGAQVLLYKLIGMISPKEILSESDEIDLEQKRQSELEMINNFSSDIDDEIIKPAQYPLENDRHSILNNLRILDVSREEVYKLDKLNGDKISMFKDLMDGLELVKEIGNIRRWKRIRKIIKSIMDSGDENLIEPIRQIWKSRYDTYWSAINFVDLVDNRIKRKEKQLIEDVINLLKINLA